MSELPRPPGRPPKLRECDVCRTSKPSGAFAPKATTCRDCRAAAAPPIESRHDVAVKLGVMRRQLPGPGRQDELLADAFGHRQMMEAIKQVTAGFARCGCCLNAEHIRYVEGRAFCALCACTIEVCGRCVEHQGPQIFPELAGNPAPGIPVDVRMLFEAPDVVRRLRSANPLEASPEP